MQNVLHRSAAVLAGAFLILFSSLAAQQTEKSAPRIVEPTTTAAGKSALSSALGEVENIGGPARYDSRLKAILDTDPEFGLGRAYYAGWHSGLTDVERKREFATALRNAAGASAAEIALIAAIREWRLGDASAARELFDAVRRIAPDDPHVHLLRQFVAAGPQDAMKLGKEAAEKFPEYAPSWNIYAYTLQNAGQRDAALDALKRYVDLQPGHPNPHDSYAEILAMQGRLDESDAHYRRVLELDPAWEIAHEGLAENEFKRGNVRSARAHLMESLRAARAPQRQIAVRRELAATYLAENNVKEAEAQLGAAIKLAQENQLAASAQTDYRSLGLIAAARGQRTDAVNQFGMGRSEGNVFIPLNEAVLYGSLGNAAEVAKAKAAIEKNAAAAPDNANLQEAMHLTQLIDAAVRNDVNAARMHKDAVKLPVFKAYANAFMVKALARAGDKAGAAAARAEVQAYKDLNLNGEIARLIARR